MVKSVMGDVTTYYVGAHYEKTVQGSQQNERKYYFVGANRIAMLAPQGCSASLRKNGTLTWLLTDHLGSTSVTANASGNLLSSLRYTAFGEIRAASSTTTTDYRYTGQRSEAEIGLYYYVARFYDPVLGRFISADTIIPNPNSSSSWDRFGYVQNNPINLIDPSGNKACSSDGGIFDTCIDPLSITLPEFAQNFGVEFDGSWSEGNQWNVLAAVAMVGAKYGEQLGLDSSSAFKKVHGLNNGIQFIFGWKNCPECMGAGGYTYSASHIRFETLWTWNPKNRIPNVIHELGHAFNNLFWTTLSSGERGRLPDYSLSQAQRSNPNFPNRPNNPDLRKNYGFAGSFGFWQQSVQGSASEEFAVGLCEKVDTKNVLIG